MSTTRPFVFGGSQDPKADPLVEVDMHSKTAHERQRAKDKERREWTIMSKTALAVEDVEDVEDMYSSDKTQSEEAAARESKKGKETATRRLLDGAGGGYQSATLKSAAPRRFDAGSDLTLRQDFLKKAPISNKYGFLPALFFGSETSGWHNTSSIYRVCLCLVVASSLVANGLYLLISWTTLVCFRNNNLSPFEVLLLRHLVQLGVCLVFAAAKYRLREGLPSTTAAAVEAFYRVSKANRIRVITQRTVYALASAALFYALSVLPLNEVVLICSTLNVFLKPVFDWLVFVNGNGCSKLTVADASRKSSTGSRQQLDAEVVEEYTAVDSSVILCNSRLFLASLLAATGCLWMAVRMPFGDMFEPMGLGHSDAFQMLKQHTHLRGDELHSRNKAQLLSGGYLACVVSSALLCAGFSLLKASDSDESTKHKKVLSATGSVMSSEHSQLQQQYFNVAIRREFPLWMDLSLDSAITILATALFFCVKPKEWKSFTTNESPEWLVLVWKWGIVTFLVPMCAVLSQLTLGYAASHIEAGMVSFVRSSEILLSAMASVLILGVDSSWATLGATLGAWLLCLAVSLKNVAIVRVQTMLAPKYAEIGQRQAVFDDTRSQIL